MSRPNKVPDFDTATVSELVEGHWFVIMPGCQVKSYAKRGYALNAIGRSAQFVLAQIVDGEIVEVVRENGPAINTKTRSHIQCDVCGMTLEDALDLYKQQHNGRPYYRYGSDGRMWARNGAGKILDPLRRVMKCVNCS